MSPSMRSALQKARESCPLPAVGYQRLPQFPPQFLRHPPPPRTNLVTSDSNNAPMVGLMIAEMTPEPRRTPEQTDEFSPQLREVQVPVSPLSASKVRCQAENCAKLLTSLASPLEKMTESSQRPNAVADDLGSGQHRHGQDRARNTP